ncbi:hypothetical protein C349_00356 [Cryptococcus neoformans var. grubii Br795]|nr:hypothetical protein C350_00371 [Cryptococcus neoformans var. grubii MW-RSA36]OXG94019.1 hypothetical protein C349_00356 [Cryptococcus neoformans var. grubii Br795]OXL11600.1 hypothetical protein C348_00369 [Cryptococcus neoformans var. grubii Gb118]
MAQQVEEIEQDLSHIHWSWPEAIAANPARSLATPDLAMDYFAYSPFWDAKSNNNVLRTQRRIENPAYGHAEEKVELNAFMSGFEYVVAHSQPSDLFVIHRREVEPSGKRDRVTGAWFILHEKIYQCPTLFDVMSTRLKNATSLISKTLGILSENRPPANPRTTTLWRSIPSAASSQPDGIQPSSLDGAKEPDEEKRDDGLSGSSPLDGSDGKASPTGPDWHLFHALQVTRASLVSLETLAKTPAQTSDPREVLKNIEIAMDNQFGGQNQSLSGKGLNVKGGAAPVRNISVPFVPKYSAGYANSAVGLTPSTSGGAASLGVSTAAVPTMEASRSPQKWPGGDKSVPIAGAVVGASSPLAGQTGQ